ncbi:Hypothetical predicted protein, partial [Pelobates cultripes]
QVKLAIRLDCWDWFCCLHRLLKLYGNQITLLDATYRTTRYALPLFSLCVRTNVCYVVVGAFVIQQETTTSIQEALEMFKTWNPGWKPSSILYEFLDTIIKFECH